jgi:hypothetical protein
MIARDNDHRLRVALMTLTVVLLYQAGSAALKASEKLFWFDEVCTVLTARQGTPAAVWNSLRLGADTQPPLFYLIEFWVSRLTDNPQLGYRLAPIAALLVVSLCLFRFVSRRVGAAAGLIAAIVPLLTAVQSVHAIEARPYALVLAAIALAAVCWQEVERPGQSVLFGLTLAAAVSLHYYALFAFIPFALGELAYRWRTGRWRMGPCMALIGGATPLIAYWPLITVLQEYYGPGFWSQPVWAQVLTYYDLNLELPNRLGLALAIGTSVGLIGVAAAISKDRRNTSPVPLEECVAVIGFILLPLCIYSAARLVNGGLTARYALPSVFGIAAGFGYLTWWFGKREATVLVVVLLSIMGVRELRYWTSGDARTPAGPTALPKEVLEQADSTGLPLVVANMLDYLPLEYYGPPAATPLYAVVDPGYARSYLGTDSADRILVALQRIAPLHVRAYSSFTKEHRQFLLASRSGDQWNWLSSRLVADGHALTALVVRGSYNLYRVELR